MAAAFIDGHAYFADIDRGLAYQMPNPGPLTKEDVMSCYLNNRGIPASWEIRHLLLPFVEDVTPCSWEFYELARKIRKGANLTRQEEEQLPEQRGLWADKFLAAWENNRPEEPSFMVEHNYSGYGDNWGDAEWTETDAEGHEKPMRFSSIEAANREIDEFIRDAKHLGGYRTVDYRAVPARTKETAA
jgi:hypothetical protein